MTEHRRRIQLVQVGCLLARSRAVLADFEIELIQDVRARVKADPDAIRAVTASEWSVIEDAIAAMKSAGDQEPDSSRTAA